MAKTKVLVVEDNPIVAEDLKRKLKNLGYFVTDTAYSGKEAVESAMNQLPDIALMDIRLGDGMNGIDAASELKKNFNVSVIYLTAHADDDTISRAKKTEPYGYIVKPFDDSELKSAIEIAVYKQKSDQAVRDSQQWLQTTLNSIGDGVIATDEKGQISFMNPVAVGLTGWSQKEVVGKPLKEVFQIINEDTRQPVENPVKIVLEKETVVGMANHTLLITKNGKELPITDSGAPLKNDKGEIIGVVLVFRDQIKERKAERNYKRLATAINHIAEGVEITDSEPKIVYVNPAFEHITGYPKDEVLGRNPSFLQSGHHNPLFYKDMWKELLDKKIWKGIFKNKRKDGSLYHEEASISPVLDEKGEIINYVAVKRDVTAEMESEKRLKQAQKMEAVGTLAGGIAHDFNNILSSIIGFTELALKEVKKGTDLADDLHEVYAAGIRAKDLVKQILTFARQTDEEIQPVKVSYLAKEAVKFIRASIPTTIQIETTIDSDSLIMGSAIQIHQIFMNLFTNAAHAMEDNGGLLQIILKDVTLNNNDRISIQGLKPGNYVQLKISDTGQGIPEHILHSIFEPYFTTKSVGEGTGMGLAVVLGIVESYGGRITVESKLGKGTTFKIHFPIAKKGGVQAPYEIEELPLGKERLLFIDDELSITKMGSRVLEDLGYNVTTRTDSLEALDLFKENPFDFDMVITDMTMPKLTGDKLAAELMKIRPDIPVILCTGYSKNVSDQFVSEIGIRALAYKPIVTEKLAKMVRKVLDEMKTSNKK